MPIKYFRAYIIIKDSENKKVRYHTDITVNPAGYAAILIKNRLSEEQSYQWYLYRTLNRVRKDWGFFDKKTRKAKIKHLIKENAINSTEEEAILLLLDVLEAYFPKWALIPDWEYDYDAWIKRKESEYNRIWDNYKEFHAMERLRWIDEFQRIEIDEFNIKRKPYCEPNALKQIAEKTNRALHNTLLTETTPQLAEFLKIIRASIASEHGLSYVELSEPLNRVESEKSDVRVVPQNPNAGMSVHSEEDDLSTSIGCVIN